MVVSDTGKNLERRIKKQVHGPRHSALVRFPKGLGELCAEEVRAALATPLFKEGGRSALQDAAVEIEDIGFRELAALALRLTTAREILWKLAEKKTTSKTEVRALLERIPWDLYLPPGTTLGLRVSSTASRLYHETMVKELAAKVFNGLDYDVSSGTPQFMLDLRLFHDRMTISLALSAAALHRRGYKTVLKGLASVKEDLAAGAVRLALDQAKSFVPDLIFVPFAGSGTLAFEAIMALGGIAPACFMAPISIEETACMPEATRGFIRRKLIEVGDAPRVVPNCQLVEIDVEQTEALAANAAGFNERLMALGRRPVTFDTIQGDALDPKTWPRSAERVLILLNPPYGDRLSASEKKGESLYAAIGKRLEKLSQSADVIGSVFAPTAKTADEIASTSPSLEWTRLPVSHGGRPILLLGFRRR